LNEGAFKKYRGQGQSKSREPRLVNFDANNSRFGLGDDTFVGGPPERSEPSPQKLGTSGIDVDFSPYGFDGSSVNINHGAHRSFDGCGSTGYFGGGPGGDFVNGPSGYFEYGQRGNFGKEHTNSSFGGETAANFSVGTSGSNLDSRSYGSFEGNTSRGPDSNFVSGPNSYFEVEHSGNFGKGPSGNNFGGEPSCERNRRPANFGGSSGNNKRFSGYDDKSDKSKSDAAILDALKLVDQLKQKFSKKLATPQNVDNQFYRRDESPPLVNNPANRRSDHRYRRSRSRDGSGNRDESSYKDCRNRSRDERSGHWSCNNSGVGVDGGNRGFNNMVSIPFDKVVKHLRAVFYKNRPSDQ
jgi:hypothetical protein